MSAFDHIADAAGRGVARVREDVAPAAARVEVVVTQRHGILAALALIAVAGAAYWQGGADGRARMDAYVAEERVVATEERNRQAAASHAVEDAALTRATKAEAAARDAQGRIDAYVTELASRPVSDRCALSDADLRGLRVGPAPARPRRRQARPAAAPE